MKITAAIRGRTAEIITGILLMVYTLSTAYSTLKLYTPDFSFYWLNGQERRMLVIYVAACLFYVVIGAMFIFRTYRRLPMKIAYCITGIAALACSGGGLIIRGCLGEENFAGIQQIPVSYMIRYLGETVIMCAVMVIGFMTINRNIIWKSRKHLLICSYIALGLIAVIRALDWSSVCTILLPFFMQDSSEKDDTKGIIGGAAIVAMSALPWFTHFIHRLAPMARVSAFSTGMKVVLLVLAFLTPLMVFERELREDEKFAAEKKAAEKNEWEVPDGNMTVGTEVFDDNDNNN